MTLLLRPHLIFLALTGLLSAHAKPPIVVAPASKGVAVDESTRRSLKDLMREYLKASHAGDLEALRMVGSPAFLAKSGFNDPETRKKSKGPPNLAGANELTALPGPQADSWYVQIPAPSAGPAGWYLVRRVGDDLKIDNFLVDFDPAAGQR